MAKWLFKVSAAEQIIDRRAAKNALLTQKRFKMVDYVAGNAANKPHL